MQGPIHVICDRCRAEGMAGEDPFAAFGDLLDFDPVPRRTARADGWDAEVQRAYIAALSLTGSDRAACRAVGKSSFGVNQLIAHEGAEGFRAAREEALAIAADERGRRLAEGLRTVAAEQSGWKPAPPPWSGAATRSPSPLLLEPPSEEELDTPEAANAWLDGIIYNYLIKVEQEREARLAGEVVAADFYVRQMTWLEVAIDLLSGDGFQALRDFRCAGHDLIDIAETPISSILGTTRRLMWERLGEPPRPEHPPRHLLKDHGGFCTEPLESTRGGLPLSHEQQQRQFDEQHAQAAAAQLAWEAAARRDYEERRASDASSRSRDAACRPACQAEGEDTTDVTNSVRDGPSSPDALPCGAVPPQDPPPDFPGEGDHAKHGGGAGGEAAPATGEQDR